MGGGAFVTKNTYLNRFIVLVITTLLFTSSLKAPSSSSSLSFSPSRSSPPSASLIITVHVFLFLSVGPSGRRWAKFYELLAISVMVLSIFKKRNGTTLRSCDDINPPRGGEYHDLPTPEHQVQHNSSADEFSVVVYGGERSTGVQRSSSSPEQHTQGMGVRIKSPLNWDPVNSGLLASASPHDWTIQVIYVPLKGQGLTNTDVSHSRPLTNLL
ncbi:hypothetical protein Hamer_G003011 [Homarus americanus]|uniref:Uncharacterized protein n=1 Tax=Homarus americanus TaxID=6706 RepID=A0A8J5MTT0_HOMAM|nr:hypothetical protein Hamer_G003011 [Homarus americanus]